jgi:hypothetical protein
MTLTAEFQVHNNGNDTCMYIGVGAIVLILLVLLVIFLMRRA